VRVESTDLGELPFSTLYRAYMAGDVSLAPDYHRFPAVDGTLRTAVRDSWVGDRHTLVDLLTRFNAPYAPHEAARTNIRRLADPASRVVVTGQQAAIAGGPAFTAWKALTAIDAARRLEAATGVPVVPVFWLADEDSDLAEITSIGFPTRDGWYHDILSLESDTAHAAGFVRVGADRRRFLDAMKAHLPESDFKADVTALLEGAYTSDGLTLVEGFAQVLTSLFSKHGLVLAGSNHPDIKRVMAEPMAIAAERHAEIEAALRSRSEDIARRHHAQAHVGPTLLFEHHPDNGRTRIDEVGTELASDIRRNPSRFSPNVFLRPILQDTLLPTAAYVAGPAETAYYAQMADLYPLFGRRMPVILPRWSVTVVEPAVARYLDDMPLPWTGFRGRAEDVERNLLAQMALPDVDQRMDRWRQTLSDIATEHVDFTRSVDPTLAATAESIIKEQQNALEKLRQKLLRSLKTKEETRLRRAQQIRQSLFPNGTLQEREWALAYPLARFGADFYDRALAALSGRPTDRHHLLYP
jgi:bacillithiol biosynthesis cysteine-adding enzyme BshC